MSYINEDELLEVTLNLRLRKKYLDLTKEKEILEIKSISLKILLMRNKLIKYLLKLLLL